MGSSSANSGPILAPSAQGQTAPGRPGAVAHGDERDMSGSVSHVRRNAWRGAGRSCRGVIGGDDVERERGGIDHAGRARGDRDGAGARAP